MHYHRAPEGEHRMRWLLCCAAILTSSGCMFFVRPPIERGLRVTNERFEVVTLNEGHLTQGQREFLQGTPARGLVPLLDPLSEDQRKVLKESGTPKFIVFENELGTGKPVQRWVYPADKVAYVFLAGKKVDYVVVDSAGKNPLLDAAQGDQGPLLIAWQWIQLVGHWLRD